VACDACGENEFKVKQLCGTLGDLALWYEIVKNVGCPQYIHWLTDKYTTTYIHRLTDEYMRIYSSVENILLGTEEFKNIEEYILFSCSDFLCFYYVFHSITFLFPCFGLKVLRTYYGREILQDNFDKAQITNT
jgi:hypothetical protein